MDHNDRPDGTEAQPPACVERELALALSIQELDIEHPAEVITEVVGGGRLKRPFLATHHRLDGIGAQRAGELLGLGLLSGNHRNRQFGLDEILVNAQHLAGAFLGLFQRGVRGVAFLPEKFQAA